jgi:hypothetical protein
MTVPNVESGDYLPFSSSKQPESKNAFESRRVQVRKTYDRLFGFRFGEDQRCCLFKCSLRFFGVLHGENQQAFHDYGVRQIESCLIDQPLAGL